MLAGGVALVPKFGIYNPGGSNNELITDLGLRYQCDDGGMCVKWANDFRDKEDLEGFVRSNDVKFITIKTENDLYTESMSYKVGNTAYQNLKSHLNKDNVAVTRAFANSSQADSINQNNLSSEYGIREALYDYAFEYTGISRDTFDSYYDKFDLKAEMSLIIGDPKKTNFKFNVDVANLDIDGAFTAGNSKIKTSIVMDENNDFILNLKSKHEFNAKLNLNKGEMTINVFNAQLASAGQFVYDDMNYSCDDNGLCSVSYQAYEPIFDASNNTVSDNSGANSLANKAPKPAIIEYVKDTSSFVKGIQKKFKNVSLFGNIPIVDNLTKFMKKVASPLDKAGAFMEAINDGKIGFQRKNHKIGKGFTMSYDISFQVEANVNSAVRTGSGWILDKVRDHVIDKPINDINSREDRLKQFIDKQVNGTKQ